MGGVRGEPPIKLALKKGKLNRVQGTTFYGVNIIKDEQKRLPTRPFLLLSLSLRGFNVRSLPSPHYPSHDTIVPKVLAYCAPNAPALRGDPVIDTRFTGFVTTGGAT